MFKGSFKGTSRICQVSFKGVSRKIEWCSEKYFLGDSRKVQWPLKEIQRVVYGSFKAVSRQFQRHIKKVSKVFKGRVKCVSRKLKKKLQVFFKECSMKFCFAILILHGSHRSYPSRRRACFFSSP